MSEELLDRVLRHEGFKNKPYLDTVGVSTFGHGLTYITAEESRHIVAARLHRLRGHIYGEYDWLFLRDEALIDVLTEMAFQLGLSGTYKFTKMWAALEEQDYVTAAAEMLDSKWAIQTPGRAKELSDIVRELDT